MEALRCSICKSRLRLSARSKHWRSESGRVPPKVLVSCAVARKGPQRSRPAKTRRRMAWLNFGFVFVEIHRDILQALGFRQVSLQFARAGDIPQQQPITQVRAFGRGASLGRQAELCRMAFEHALD